MFPCSLRFFCFAPVFPLPNSPCSLVPQKPLGDPQFSNEHPRPFHMGLLNNLFFFFFFFAVSLFTTLLNYNYNHLRNLQYNTPTHTINSTITVAYTTYNTIQFTNVTCRKEKKNAAKLLRGHALTGEKKFPLLPKFPLTIQRASNVFFYFHFILHQRDEIAENEYSII